MILYLRVVPGFWTAVEERDRPELRLRPLLLLPPDGRGAVREANTAAQQVGVRPGMTLPQARQRCPDCLVRPPRLERYAAVWEDVLLLLRDVTPVVEPVTMGEAVCDLRGCDRLWGEPARIAEMVRRRMGEEIGIVPWLGVGSNRLVAQLASTVVGRSGVTVVPDGQERPFLANLPLNSLSDVDGRLIQTCEMLGIRTFGALAALPAAAVAGRFGAAGRQLHRWARGIDPRPVRPPKEPPAVRARYQCEEGSIEEALEVIRRLTVDCSDQMAERRVAGRLVEVALLRENAVSRNAVTSLPDAGAPCLEVAPGAQKERPALPAPANRIHSRLPQPPRSQPRPDLLPPIQPEVSLYSPAGRGHHAQTVLRSPVSTAGELEVPARRLLLDLWEEGSPPLIELSVSQFAAPQQLAFNEWNRLDVAGRLAGLSPEREAALSEGEKLLTARYGRDPFCHPVPSDPYSLLPERRFRWEMGR